ncbi:hypothetical protein [Terrabacter sp. NPDC000476]|uniref:hypothetical protein n=1 Tax=Terrabacter sp. NPDC000476 TaxID=3154258 RepID=UPI00331CCD85
MSLQLPSRAMVAGFTAAMLAMTGSACTDGSEAGSVVTGTQASSDPGYLSQVPSAVLSWSPGPTPWPADMVTNAVPGANGPFSATASWRADGTLLLVTAGHAGCPAMPVSVAVRDGSIIIRTKPYLEPPNEGCDMAPSPVSIVLKAPSGVDRTKPTRAVIDSIDLTIPAQAT